MKIKTNGFQVLSVPNNEYGRILVQSLRSYLNPKYKIKVRGRGARKSQGCGRDSIPLNKAEWLAIYIECPSKDALSAIRFQKNVENYYKEKKRADDLQKELNELIDYREKSRAESDALRKRLSDCDALRKKLNERPVVPSNNDIQYDSEMAAKYFYAQKNELMSEVNRLRGIIATLTPTSVPQNISNKKY